MIKRCVATALLGLAVGLAACSPAPERPQPRKPDAGEVPDRYKGSAEERAKIVRQAAEDRRAGLPWISVAELNGRMTRREPVRVLNIKAAVDEPLIEGAIVVDGPRVAEWAASAPKTPPIVVYCSCKNDASAVQAALELQKLGFEETKVLRGGLDAWQEAGLPVSNIR
jgi:rhodanese-related sulfurtransferase